MMETLQVKYVAKPCAICDERYRINDLDKNEVAEVGSIVEAMDLLKVGRDAIHISESHTLCSKCNEGLN